jgi:hypothetical protein
MMAKTNHDYVPCATFQAELPDLIGSGRSIARNRHLQNCANCRALLADLNTIAEAARQLFPPVEPSELVWEQIESIIEHEKVGHGPQ